MPRRPSAGLIGIWLTLGLLVVYLSGNTLLDVLELKTYDMRLLSAGARAPSGEVVIAAIDEKSLSRLGRWPWSRRTLSRLVERLDRLGARVIVFDVFFNEAENRPLLDQIARLEAEGGYSAAASPYRGIRQALAADATLGQTIARSGKVVMSMVFLMSEDETRHLRPEDTARALTSVERHAIGVIHNRGGKLDLPLAEPKGLLANLATLQQAALHVGHINSLPDADGTLRWAPLVMRYQGRFFPSGDVQAVRAFLGSQDLVLHTSPFGITGLSLGDRFIATDEYGHALIHYFGPEKTVATISATDILDGPVDAASLRDKIVVLGATAKGIGDIRVTPFGSTFPGVEIRATIMHNLLANDFIHRPGWMFLAEALGLLGLGIGLALVLPRLGVRNGALLTATVLALYLGVALALFRQGLWLNLVYPVLLGLLLFMATALVKYFTTEIARRQMKAAFQHYVPAKVVDEITRDVTKLRLGGEKRELTVLFSDIRGFTSVAETLSPEDLVKLLNTYLTQMTEKVFRYDGLLDKYIGDAIMAVYGAPIHRPDHARLACRTALDMLAALKELHAEWRRTGRPLLDIGIGINTGPMIVGNMGSETRFDYTVIGDAVNLGARIEALNKVYGTHVLMSEFTYRQVQDEFPHVREVDLAAVRGRQEPVRLYELIPDGAYPHLDWLEEYARAYALFHEQRLAEAMPQFAALSAAVNDPVSQYYLRRCQQRHTDERC
jgi:adenylate cyclase